MPSALIGYTGFVGSNLNRQHRFDRRYNSKNIEEISGQRFDLLVCAGVQAVKWWANQNPDEDRQGIARLLERLKDVQADRFVLISTVDVYPSPIEVDEDLDLTELDNHPYGRHRLEVERFVADHFPDHLIVRLPGLFGPGLKKNVIFDLIHDNQLEKVNPAGAFQWYDLNDLWSDIEIALDNGLNVVNFAVEPISTQEIIEAFFPDKAEAVGASAGGAGRYDFRTKHAALWDGQGQSGYIRDRASLLERLGKFIESESKPESSKSL